MTPDDGHRLDIWRKEVAARRPAPSAALLARLRPLITPVLPRDRAAPACKTGAAATATSEPQQNPGGNP